MIGRDIKRAKTLHLPVSDDDDARSSSQASVFNSIIKGSKDCLSNLTVKGFLMIKRQVKETTRLTRVGIFRFVVYLLVDDSYDSVHFCVTPNLGRQDHQIRQGRIIRFDPSKKCLT